MRALEGAAVARHQAAGAVGQEEPLVRIERHGVGALDAGHGGATALGEQEEAAVGRVDVQPEPLGGGEVGEGAQVVDRAGVHRARGADHQERREAGGAIGGDRGPQRFERQPEALVAGNGADVLGGEAGEHRRLLQRVVDLVGGVEGAAEKIRGEALAARGDERREVGERAAAGEKASGPTVVAHEVREPAHDVGLELRQRRRRLPDADVAVEAVGDQLGHRRVHQPASRDVREVARPGGVEALRRRALEDQVEQLLVGRGPLGQWLGERRGHLRGAFDVGGGLARERLEVRQEAREGALHQAADLGGVGLERGGHLYRWPRLITIPTSDSSSGRRSTSPRTAMTSAYLPGLTVPTSPSTFIARAGQ